jgi:hypothetical protein
MRKRTILAVLLVVALVLGTSALAMAGSRIFVSKPDVCSRKVEVAKEFKVKGYVWPAKLSSDTVSSIAIRVFQLSKDPHTKPKWSQIATVPATWGKVLKRRFVTYEASVTIAAEGRYRLRAAIIQTDTIVAQSAHRPLTVPKPPKGHRRHM